MSEIYTRRATASLKKESSNNVAVTPDTFFPLNEEDIAVKYAYSPSMRVAGNRAKMIEAVTQKISAPAGTITLNIEPNTFGHFLNALAGGLTTGRYIDIGTIVGTFVVGETVTGGTSSNTAVVNFVGKDFLLIAAPSGALTDGETLTGGTSGATAVLGNYEATVYGHAKKLPAEMTTTYTLQFNYTESAIRYVGVRFTGIDGIAQSDNILTAGMKLMAQSCFRTAKVTAITSSGAGAKTINVDQTQGLVASDSIKVYRPSTDTFLDFPSASVKTHTITSITNDLAFVVTNLETALAVGDLIMLAPQTATYSLAKEMPWVGGSNMYFGDAIGSVASINCENFNFVIDNEFEERHAALGDDYEDRYPSALLQKGIAANGSFDLYYTNEKFLDYARRNAVSALKLVSLGAVIGSTTVKNRLEIAFPQIQLGDFDTNVTVDDIINQSIPFEAFYDSTEACICSVLIVNNITSY